MWIKTSVFIVFSKSFSTSVQLNTALTSWSFLGDFNHRDSAKSLGNVYQYITCPTWLAVSIHLCFGRVKGAFKSHNRADNQNKMLFIWVPPTNQSWSNLNRSDAWFRCGRRTLVHLHGLGLVHRHMTVWMNWLSLCAHICFCEDLVIPKKSVCVYPNNKPWNTMNQRNVSFNQGDFRNRLQMDLRRAKINH